MQIKADEGNKTAKLILKLCDRFDRTLTTVLIGNNIVAVAISSVATVLFLHYFEASSIGESVVSLISSIVVAFVVYILGDSLPKTIAKLIPDTTSRLFAWPVYILLCIFFPLSLVFEGISKLFNKIFKTHNEENFTEEDFENVVDQITDEGIIDEEQQDIIQSALEFADTSVKEVFTPKEKMVAIDINGLTHDKLHEFLLTTKYSRIPVYDREFDNMIGVFVKKTYLKAKTFDKNVSIRKILQKPYFITSNVMIDDLFQGFKKHHTHLAFVVNNKKQIIGMVTMEDVLEELVENISETTPKGRGQ